MSLKEEQEYQVLELVSNAHHSVLDSSFHRVTLHMLPI